MIQVNSTTESSASSSSISSSISSSTMTGTDDSSSTSSELENFERESFSVTPEQAIAEFQEVYPNAVLVSWNLEADDDTNMPLFTGEFEEGNNEVEVLLNAETGEILSVKND